MATLKKDRYKLNRRFLICLSVSAIVISIVAIIIGIIALCFAAYRTPLLGFDYMGLLVGILAALVTALIGWQIFTTIGVEKKINDMEKNVDEMKTLLEEEKKKINAEFENEKGIIESNESSSRGKIYFLQGHILQVLGDNRYFMVYKYYILTIYYLLKSNTEEAAKTIPAALNNIKKCLDGREEASNYNDTVDIDDLNSRINELIISKSPYFTPDQRREFMDLDKQFKEIWKNKDNRSKRIKESRLPKER